MFPTVGNSVGFRDNGFIRPSKRRGAQELRPHRSLCVCGSSLRLALSPILRSDSSYMQPSPGPSLLPSFPPTVKQARVASATSVECDTVLCDLSLRSFFLGWSLAVFTVCCVWVRQCEAVGEGRVAEWERERERCLMESTQSQRRDREREVW